MARELSLDLPDGTSDEKLLLDQLAAEDRLLAIKNSNNLTSVLTRGPIWNKKGTHLF